MITQQQLTLINRRTLKYPLDIAEKDYYLAVAAKLISESALGSQLVFKGGTALPPLLSAAAAVLRRPGLYVACGRAGYRNSGDV